MGKENPCFDCKLAITGRLAPCCYDNTMHISPSEYNRDFKGAPTVVFQKYVEDPWMGELVQISYQGACPNLDTDSGLCMIQKQKPLACRDMKPKRHALCCKAANGRQ